MKEQKAQEPVHTGGRPATTQPYRRGPGAPGGQHIEHKPGMCLWQRQPGATWAALARCDQQAKASVSLLLCSPVLGCHAELWAPQYKEDTGRLESCHERSTSMVRGTAS